MATSYSAPVNNSSSSLSGNPQYTGQTTYSWGTFTPPANYSPAYPTQSKSGVWSAGGEPSATVSTPSGVIMVSPASSVYKAGEDRTYVYKDGGVMVYEGNQTSSGGVFYASDAQVPAYSYSSPVPNQMEAQQLVSRAPFVEGLSESQNPFSKSKLALEKTGFKVDFNEPVPYYLQSFLSQQAVTTAVEKKYGYGYLTPPPATMDFTNAENRFSRVATATVTTPSKEKIVVLQRLPEIVVAGKTMSEAKPSELSFASSEKEKTKVEEVLPFREDLTNAEVEIGTRYFEREKQIGLFISTTPLLREWESSLEGVNSWFGNTPFVSQLAGAFTATIRPSTYLSLGSLGVAVGEATLSNPELAFKRMERGASFVGGVVGTQLKERPVPFVLESAGTLAGYYLGGKTIKFVGSKTVSIGSKLVSSVEVPQVVLTQPRTPLTTFYGGFKLGGKPLETGVVYDITAPKGLLFDVDFATKAQAAVKNYPSFSSNVRAVVGRQIPIIQIEAPVVSGTKIFPKLNYLEYNRLGFSGLSSRFSEAVSRVKSSYVEQKVSVLSRYGDVPTVATNLFTGTKTISVIPQKAVVGPLLFQPKGVYFAGDELAFYFKSNANLPKNFGSKLTSNVNLASKQIVESKNLMERVSASRSFLSKSVPATTFSNLNLGVEAAPKLSSTQLSELNAFLKQRKFEVMKSPSSEVYASFRNVFGGKSRPLAPLEEQVYAADKLPSASNAVTFESLTSKLNPARNKVVKVPENFEANFRGLEISSVEGKPVQPKPARVINVPPKFEEGFRGIEISSVEGKANPPKPFRLIKTPPEFEKGFRGVEISSVDGKPTPPKPIRVTKIPPKFEEGFRGVNFEDLTSQKIPKQFKKPLKPFESTESSGKPPETTNVGGGQVQITKSPVQPPVKPKSAGGSGVPPTLKGSGKTISPPKTRLALVPTAIPTSNPSEVFIPAIRVSYERSLKEFANNVVGSGNSVKSTELFLQKVYPYVRPTMSSSEKEASTQKGGFGYLPREGVKPAEQLAEKLAEQTKTRDVFQQPKAQSVKVAEATALRERTAYLELLKERQLTEFEKFYRSSGDGDVFLQKRRSGLELPKSNRIVKAKRFKFKRGSEPIVYAGPFSKLRAEARTLKPAFHPVQTKAKEKELYRNLFVGGLKEIKALPFRKKARRFLA